MSYIADTWKLSVKEPHILSICKEVCGPWQGFYFIWDKYGDLSGFLDVNGDFRDDDSSLTYYSSLECAKVVCEQYGYGWEYKE